MPAGLQVFNPGGTLVVSADAIGYRYFGTATLYTAGSKTQYYAEHPTSPPIPYYAGSINPHVYRVTLPNSTMVPIIGLTLDSTKIQYVENIESLGGGVWQITIQCVNRSGAGYYLNNMSVASPSPVHVFCPYSNSDLASGAGLQLFDASGNLTFSSAYKPLWFTEKVDCAAGFAGDMYAPYPPFSTTWSNPANPVLVLAGRAGDGNRRATSSQEDVFTGYYGWTFTGTSLRREFFVTQHDFRPTDGVESDPYDTEDSYGTVYATSVMVVNGGGL